MSTRRSEPAPARHHDLREGWEFCATPAGTVLEPSRLPQSANWIGTTVPTTAASALRAAGAWSIDGPERRFDAEDWWFRTEIEAPADINAESCQLRFEGLATLCDVWLNGKCILQSTNMFLSHRIEAPPLRAGTNQLYLQFRSLDLELQRKKPRPRWRTPMVENQQLRWHRTTLLGRTPGWSPPTAAVGPWKAVGVGFGNSPGFDIELLRSELQANEGRVELRLKVFGEGRDETCEVQLRHQGSICARATPRPRDGGLAAELTILNPERWWPHTHGRPQLYEVVLLRQEAGGPTVHALGQIGFREVQIERHERRDFRIRVNGTQIFCRGACWTPLDIASLRAEEGDYRKALQQAVDAGFNMLRLSGAMIYEDEVFFRLCDELGVLVWQDFMFANMDYPFSDASFADSVQQEAIQHLTRWAAHASVTVICGNSEVSQQAAMWGAPRELWEPEFFGSSLARLVAEHCPGAAYWASSALGGDFPHQTSAGTASYYGVGAYLRGLVDLRRSELRFATECLGFANVPEDENLALLPNGANTRVHHASWKARSPRDLGAGWDFDDVRDHYIRELFGIDPLPVRYSDHARYLKLGRIAVAEAMSAAFTEWRRQDSTCGGALIWFLRDLWPGAGWGIVDSTGVPKAPYHALRQVLQPTWLGITDEGLNGVTLHMGNDAAEEQHGTLELLLYRGGRSVVAQVSRSVTLPARRTLEVSAASMLPAFHDLTFAYRFGPPSCDLIVAVWKSHSSPLSCRAFHVPVIGDHIIALSDVVLGAKARLVQPGIYAVSVNCTAFARAVQLQADGYCCDEPYFWLAPNETREVVLRATGSPRPLFGFATSINSSVATKIEILQC